MSTSALLAHVKNVWSKSIQANAFDTLLVPKLRILSATHGQVQCGLQVEPQHLNRLGGIHGGTIAALIDITGSLAVASQGYDTTGVSTDINVSYMAPAHLNDELVINATCRRMGRTLAFTRVELLVGGTLIAEGRHNKCVIKAVPSTGTVS